MRLAPRPNFSTPLASENSIMSDPQSTAIKILGQCRIETPIKKRLGERALHFVGAADQIVLDHKLSAVAESCKRGQPPPAFELAGPRDKIFFDPSKVRCGIVTCGGLCPGLNNVIQGLVSEMNQGYGIKRIYGFRYGYQGFIAKYNHPVMELTPENVDHIHEAGGTILSSSRGHQSREEIVDCLERLGVGILFVIGGDGTIRGCMGLVDEITQRGLKIAVVAIPKTIDNDISYTDRSFGFDTAYTKAVEFIRAAHAEARGAPNGIGLVKLMGRHSGFIACNAALASRETDFVLIPEVPFKLEGENGFLAHLKRHIQERGHAVIVAAEGAGQEYMGAGESSTQLIAKDASGNTKLKDIGIYLKDRITQYFSDEKVELNLKYIDPSYVIRSVPASAPDAIYCWKLARFAAHAAMAGNTELIVSMWHGQFVHIPMQLAVSERKSVDPDGFLWMSVLEATGQPTHFG
jgi:6-phosphofructokinase 1